MATGSSVRHLVEIQVQLKQTGQELLAKTHALLRDIGATADKVSAPLVTVERRLGDLASGSDKTRVAIQALTRAEADLVAQQERSAAAAKTVAEARQAASRAIETHLGGGPVAQAMAASRVGSFVAMSHQGLETLPKSMAGDLGPAAAQVSVLLNALSNKKSEDDKLALAIASRLKGSQAAIPRAVAADMAGVQVFDAAKAKWIGLKESVADASGSAHQIGKTLAAELKAVSISLRAQPPANYDREQLAVSRKYTAQTLADPLGMMAKYYQTVPVSQRNVANPDEARKIFPEYNANPQRMNLAVHEASSAISKLAYADLIDRAAARGGGTVAIMMGGAGSGKTTASADIKSAADAVLDITGANANSVSAAVKKALDAGLSAQVRMVYRNPEESFEGTIQRAMDKGSSSYGRIVPFDVAAQQHAKIPGSFVEVAKTFEDEIRSGRLSMSMAMNTGKISEPPEILTGTKAVEKAAEIAGRFGNSADKMAEDMLVRLDQMKRAGTVTPDVYEIASTPGSMSAEDAARIRAAATSRTNATLEVGSQVRPRDTSLTDLERRTGMTEELKNNVFAMMASPEFQRIAERQRVQQIAFDKRVATGEGVVSIGVQRVGATAEEAAKIGAAAAAVSASRTALEAATEGIGKQVLKGFDQPGMMVHVAGREFQGLDSQKYSVLLKKIATEGLRPSVPQESLVENPPRGVYFWPSTQAMSRASKVLEKEQGLPGYDLAGEGEILGFRRGNLDVHRDPEFAGQPGLGSSRYTTQVVKPEDLFLYDQAKKEWVALTEAVGASGVAANITSKKVVEGATVVAGSTRQTLPTENVSRSAIPSEDIDKASRSLITLKTATDQTATAQTEADRKVRTLRQSIVDEGAAVGKTSELHRRLGDELRYGSFAQGPPRRPPSAAGAGAPPPPPPPEPPSRPPNWITRMLGQAGQQGSRGLAEKASSVFQQTGIFAGTPGLAGSIATSALESIGTGSATALAVGGGLLAVGAVVGVTKALESMAKSLSENAREIENMSQRTGIATGDIQAFASVSHEAGVSSSEMVLGLRFLNRSIATGDPLLKTMGITTKDTTKAFIQLSDWFAKSADGSAKTEVAMRLLGRSGTALIPVLNQGSSSIMMQVAATKGMGAVISQEALPRLEAMHRALTLNATRFQAFGVAVKEAMIPLMEGAVAAAGVVARGFQSVGNIIATITTSIRAMRIEAMGAKGALDDLGQPKSGTGLATRGIPIAGIVGVLGHALSPEATLEGRIKSLEALERALQNRISAKIAGGTSLKEVAESPEFQKFKDVDFDVRAMREGQDLQRMSNREKAEKIKLDADALDAALANTEAQKAAADAAKAQAAAVADLIQKLKALTVDTATVTRATEKLVTAFTWGPSQTKAINDFRRDLGAAGSEFEEMAKSAAPQLQFEARTKALFDQFNAFRKTVGEKPVSVPVDLEPLRELERELEAAQIVVSKTELRPRGLKRDEFAGGPVPVPELKFGDTSQVDGFAAIVKLRFKEIAEEGTRLSDVATSFANGIFEGATNGINLMLDGLTDRTKTFYKTITDMLKEIAKEILRSLILLGIKTAIKVAGGGVPFTPVSPPTMPIGETPVGNVAAAPTGGVTSAARSIARPTTVINNTYNALDLGTIQDRLRSPFGTLRRAFEAEYDRGVV